MRRSLVTALVLFSAASSAAPPALHSEPLALPDGSSGVGFDDLFYANQLGKVLVPAGRTGKLDLVDPATHTVRAVGNFTTKSEYSGGHDDSVTSADEGRGLLFATDRTARKLSVIDPASGAVVGEAPLAAEPDYVRYVAATDELWVTEPDAERIEIFALQEKRPTHRAEIRVVGGPESLLVDGKRGRAYTHLWKGATVAIDLKTHALGAPWKNGCEGSRGIALDEARGQLFVGCSEGRATVLDVNSGATLATLRASATVSGVDVIGYNAALRHLYLAGAKSATLAIVGVATNGTLTLLGSMPTARGAHCVVADPQGQAWVCDPNAGRLLLVKDPFPKAH